LADERGDVFAESVVIEALISLAIVVSLCVIGWAVQASAEALLFGGMALAAVGFGYGIPSAVVYHAMLYRSLSRCDRLPARWWLHPTSLHDRLPASDRMGVLCWAMVGGTGFLVIVLGIVLTSIGLWRTLSV
jgi:hypothetical protein